MISKKNFPDITAFLQPHMSGLSSLIKPISCCVVRMTEVGAPENRSMYGDMVWPEVLVCLTADSAEVLKDFLNIQSYQDSRGAWLEEEPYLTEEEVRRRWENEDPVQYVVEAVPDLSKYDNFDKVPESIAVAKALFKEVRFD